MAFTEALRLIVDADTRGAVKGIEKFGATADREISRSEKALDKWGNRLTSLGTGMITFGAAALVGLGALAKESEEANLAQVKLQNTIDNMPRLAGATAKEFTDLAESIQDVTAADADAIVEAEALLGTFNLTAQQIKGITPLVVDYARKFGIDMADAAVQVGKALDGQAGALKRNGVSIDEALFATDRYRAVQEALSNQVGGFAETEGKTFAGSLERMRNQLGDLAEGVGGGAVDAFTTMFGAVEKVAGALESISPGAQNAIGQIATFGAVGLIAAGGISTVIGQAIKARHNFEALGSVLSAATTKLGGIRTAASLAAGAAGLAALVVVAKQVSDATDDLQVNGGKLAEALTSTSDRTRGAVAEFITLVDHMGRLDRAFDAVLEANAAAGDDFIRTAESVGVSGDKIDELRAKLEEKKATDIGAAAAQQEYTNEVQEGAGASEDAASAVQSYNDALKALLDPLFGAVHAQEQLQDANSKVIEAEGALATAISEHGASSQEAAIATEELRRAQIDAAAAALGQEAAMSQLKDAVADGTVSVDAAKAKLQEWVAQGLITQASADTTAAKFDEVADSADRLDGRNVRLTIDVITRETTILAGSRNVPRQHGGPVEAGQAYIVGEKQAELFVPDRSGYVLPFVPREGTMTPWAGGGGGGIALTVQVNNPIVANEREFQRMVTSAANQGLASGEINVRGRRVA